jgi:ATP-dependent protease HslVU (ClpYQ) peptidase subunit
MNMSVVVAIKHKGKVFIGADSQVTKGGTRQTMSNRSNYKIWHIESADHAILGSVGSLREMNLIKTESNLIDEITLIKKNINYRYVVREFTQRIFQILERYGLIQKDEDGTTHLNNSYLFAYEDQLYYIGKDMAVIEIDEYAAIGSGANEAIGSLLSTDTLQPEERLMIAIKASATNDIYVDYPIIIANTEDRNFKVIADQYQLVKGEQKR